MQFFIFVLLICLFIFLFCVYSLSKDDFVLLRKDVSMDKLFNLIFLGSLFCLFGARLFYGIFYAKNILLNPFVFLFFPYFPGLSMVGGVVGAILAFLFLHYRKKILPLGRISDFFSVAFLVTIPVGILGYSLFLEEFYIIKTVYFMTSYIILFVFFLKVFLPQFLSGKLKDGAITFLFLICFSVVSLIGNFIANKGSVLTFKLIPEDFVLLLIIIGSIVMLVRNENLLGRFKKFKKPAKS